MSLISLPFLFTPGTTIVSAQVNADFNAIISVVNGNLDATNLSTVFVDSNLQTAKGHATIAGGLIINWGQQSSVAFDNTGAVVVTFDKQYASFMVGVWFNVVENTQAAGKAQAVSCYSTATSPTGFTFNALGGQAGQQGQVNWVSIGF